VFQAGAAPAASGIASAEENTKNKLPNLRNR